MASPAQPQVQSHVQHRLQQHVVVVGAGAAGHSAASTLRRDGYTGRLTVLHGEAHPPYNRTLVNKGVLPGLLTAEQVALPALESLGVEVVPARATALDADDAEVVLEGGERLSYTALIVATGSTPRPLPPTLPSADADSDRVLGMHTVGDAARVRDLLGANPGAARVTLLGAGFIGAETASYLAGLGTTVHLVSRSELPLVPAVGDTIAQRIVGLHQAHVKTHFRREVLGVRAGVDSVAVTLDDGTRLESELAVVAYGTHPASGWASGGTEAADGGIGVDDRLRAQHLRGVYAAGSVALHRAASQARYRVDHWDAAIAQGAHAARTLLLDLTGAPDPGAYAPTTGFTLNLYRQPIAAYGVPLPGAQQRQHPVDSEGGILTTFHHPRTGALTAAAALGASRELLALRDRL